MEKSSNNKKPSSNKKKPIFWYTFMAFAVVAAIVGFATVGFELGGLILLLLGIVGVLRLVFRSSTPAKPSQ